MFVFLVNTPLQNTIAEQNVPNQPPTRTNEQIIPRSQWLTIEKSNLLFNAQKIQKNPIFRISVDILKKLGVYLLSSLIEQWFDLSADLLRKALAITPVIPAQPFELPPSGNTVIDFVNELGYPEPVEIVSNIRVNYVYQPWRAILTLINQCLTGKTSGQCQNRHPVRKCCGYRHQTNVDHAEDSLWEEFSQGIRYFSLKSKSHSPSLKHPRESTPLSSFFMDGFPRKTSRKCMRGGSVGEVHLATRRTPPKKPTTTTLVKPSKHKLPQKVRKGKPTFHLVDEDDEAQQESIPQKEGNDPDLEIAKKMSLEAHHGLRAKEEIKKGGQGTVRGVTIRDPISKTTPKTARSSRPGKRPLRDQSPHDSKTGPSSHPEDDTSEKVIHESSSTSDSEHGTEVKQEAAALKVTRSR
ncbi:hypothetical protein Tco_0308870 [Tanacetum coccineum]